MADLQVLVELLGRDKLSGPATSATRSLGLLQTGAIAAGAALGVALVGGMVAGIKAAGDLEQAVANVSTIKPEIDTSGVFTALNEMQTRVPQSAAQLGDALYNVFSSVNVTQEEGLALVEKFARGATGAATDAQTFGTAVMGVMNAYSLSVEDADHISDVFFNTVNAGVVTGQELASSLGPVTQAAKMAGVNLDELGGMIAGVTKEGGPAAQNINNLQNTLSKITTKEAQKHLNELGVATVDSAGKFRPVMDILGDLKGRMGDMSESAKALALQEIFPDQQARQGAATLMSQLDFVNEAIQTNVTSAGAASSAFEKMSKTFNTQSKLAQQAVMSVLTAIGAEALPLLTPLISAFAEWLPAAFKSTKEALEPVGAFFQDDILPILTTLGEVAQRVFAGDFPGALGIFQDEMGASTATLSETLSGWAEAFVGWVAEAIPPMLIELVGLTTQLYQWIYGTALPGIVEQLASWAAAFFEWVGPMIPNLLRNLGGLLTDLVGWIVDTALPGIVSTLVRWGGAFFEWVGPAIGPMIMETGKLLLELGGWIQDTALPQIKTRLQQWGLAFLSWVGNDVLPALGGTLTTILDAIGTWITGTGVPWLIDKAKGLGTAIISGIVAGLNPGALVSRMQEIAGGAIQAGADAIRAHSPSEEAKERIGEPMILGIIAGLEAKRDVLMEAVEGIAGAVLTAFAPLREPLGPLEKDSRYAGMFAGGDGQDMPDLFGPNPAAEALLIQYGYLEEAASDYAAEVWDVGDATRSLLAEYGLLEEAGETLESVMFGQNQAAIALLEEYGYLTEAGQSLEEIMFGDNQAARDLLAEFGLLEIGVDDLGIAFDEAGGKATRWGAVIAGETTETGQKVHEFTHSYLGNLVAIGEVTTATAATVVTDYQSIAMAAQGLTSILGDATRAFDKLNAAAAASPVANAYGGSAGGSGPGVSHTILPTLPHASALAAGTTDWGGGFAMVGELGPELAYLPPHSAVYPHGTGPSGGGGLSGRDVQQLAAAVANALRGITVEMDRQPVGRLVRTDNRYYNQSNLTNGVGGL